MGRPLFPPPPSASGCCLSQSTDDAGLCAHGCIGGGGNMTVQLCLLLVSTGNFSALVDTRGRLQPGWWPAARRRRRRRGLWRKRQRPPPPLTVRRRRRRRRRRWRAAGACCWTTPPSGLTPARAPVRRRAAVYITQQAPHPLPQLLPQPLPQPRLQCVLYTPDNRRRVPLPQPLP